MINFDPGPVSLKNRCDALNKPYLKPVESSKKSLRIELIEKYKPKYKLKFP